MKPASQRLLLVANILLLAAVTAPGVSAQSQLTGAVLGVVHEEGNPQAGVANARVTIFNLRTGLQYVSTTESNGAFLFPLIDPAFYRISTEAAGYIQIATSRIDRFKVDFNQTTRVALPPLELRRVGAAVNPSPSVPNVAPVRVLVNLNDASRSASFDDRLLQALPLSGFRTFDQLALLAAGVASPPQPIGNMIGPGVGPGVGTSGQFAVNGLRSRANNFTVDGSDNNDEDIGVRRQGFTALVPQSIESLQGFHITTLLPTPQYGRNLGSQVNALSFSGSQLFHGTLYGFLTDRRLKARDAFDLTGGPVTFPIIRPDDGRAVLLDGRPLQPANPVRDESPFTRAQSGFVIGGPLTTRHTFFFGSFEHRDLNATRESNFAVPTVSERGLFASGDRGLLVRVNNQTREAFPTSAYGDAFFSLFPFPNNPRGPYGANTFTEQLRATADGTIFSFKVDQSLRALEREHQLTGRYNFTDDATTLPVTGEALFSSLRARVRTNNLSLFDWSQLNARLSNEARFSYGRTRLEFDELRNPFLLPSRKLPQVPYLLNARMVLNATLPSDPNPSYQSTSGVTEDVTQPVGQVRVSGYSPIGVDALNFPQRRVNNTFQIADTLIYKLGVHRLVGGFDIRRTQLNSSLDRNFRSAAMFGGSFDLASSLGFENSLAPNLNGFYLGADFAAVGAATGFYQTQAIVPDSTIGLRYWQNNFFVADDVSLRPNIKVTLGLRYEINTVPSEVNQRIESTFDSAQVKGLIAAEKQLYGTSGFERYLDGRKSIFSSDHNNLSPHLAFAWDPFGDGKTSVRGGYGIYYDQIPGAVISQSRSVFPRFLTLNLAGYSADQAALIAFNPALLSLPGTLNTYNSSLGLGTTFLEVLLRINQFANRPLPNQPQSNFGASAAFVLPEADLETPYAQHWALTVEREVGRALLVSLAYVGTKGTHLLRFGTPNLGANAIPVVTGGVLSGEQIDFRGFVTSPGKDLRRPYPLLGSFSSIQADANSSYQSLQAEAHLQATHGLQFTAAYTWSHAIDEVSDLFDLGGARGLPQNSFNRRGERGDANFDVRHRLAHSFVWDVPLWAQHRLIGGWQLAGIVTLQTGQPFTVVSGVDSNLDGNLTDRLNTLIGVHVINQGSLRYQFPSSKSDQFKLLAAAGNDGVVGRNTFRAPGVAVVDVAANKHFQLSERHQIEVRAEFFNLFNRTHFDVPVHEVFAPALGRAVQTTIQGRTVQLALRYRF